MKNLMKNLRQKHSKIQVCFLLDCTLSMDKYKEATKDCINQVIKKLQEMLKF